MKLILLKEVENLGKDGRLIEVADGYARNYLLPQGLATLATPQAMAAAEKRRKKEIAALERQKEVWQALAKKLQELEITIESSAGEEGKLFGSVTSQDIVAAAQKEGIDLDRRKIVLEEPIKLIGEYQVPIKLHPEIPASLKVKIIAKH